MTQFRKDSARRGPDTGEQPQTTTAPSGLGQPRCGPTFPPSELGPFRILPELARSDLQSAPDYMWMEILAALPGGTECRRAALPGETEFHPNSPRPVGRRHGIHTQEIKTTDSGCHMFRLTVAA